MLPFPMVKPAFEHGILYSERRLATNWAHGADYYTYILCAMICMLCTQNLNQIIDFQIACNTGISRSYPRWQKIRSNPKKLRAGL